MASALYARNKDLEEREIFVNFAKNLTLDKNENKRIENIRGNCRGGIDNVGMQQSGEGIRSGSHI